MSAIKEVAVTLFTPLLIVEGGWTSGFVVQAPVVQTLDSAIHRINHYPADSVIDFRNTYRLDSDLSGG